MGLASISKELPVPAAPELPDKQSLIAWAKLHGLKSTTLGVVKDDRQYWNSIMGEWANATYPIRAGSYSWEQVSYMYLLTCYNHEQNNG